MGYMNVADAIETRLEIREFTDESVDDGTKREILDAGRRAPSGKNTQHWSFVLVEESGALSRLASISTSGQWVREAAFVVVVLTDPTYEFHEIDAGRAVTHMQLAAWSEGVGSCLYTGFDDDRMRSFLEYPASVTATLVAGFGYPKRPARTFAGQKDRLPLAEVGHRGTFGTALRL